MYKTTVIDNKDSHTANPAKSISGHSGKSLRYHLAVFPFALILLISTSYQQRSGDPGYEKETFAPWVKDSLKNYINAVPGNTASFFGAPAWTFIKDFYTRIEYQPIWIHFNGMNDQAKDLVSLIEHAREMGLEPHNYHFDAIAERMRQVNQAREKDKVVMDFNMELLLTDAAFRLMINLHAGYQPLDSALYASAWVNNLRDVMILGIQSGRLSDNILSVEPGFVEYRNLRRASTMFIRTNVLNDQGATINYPCKDSVVLVAQIREALESLGYMDPRNPHGDVAPALQKFQQYHGLEPDGKPGTHTVEALGKSTLYKYRVLALNLDRLRKKQFPDSSLLYVNIPSYRLKIFEGNQLRDTFRIIVGSPSSPTPMLSGNMERIIANPVWYVPRSIALNEMLPKMKEDSGYLARNGFRVLDKNFRLVDADALDLANASANDFEYTFRQDRGSDNSLGKVKFIFSNPYAIYLHDTPGKSLFSKDLRAFSHGCIRVEHPERLADYILTNVNSDTTSFTRVMDGGQQREFSISSRLPVHITYITCEADAEGEVYFYKDIYGIDQQQLEVLSPFMGI